MRIAGMDRVACLYKGYSIHPSSHKNGHDDIMTHVTMNKRTGARHRERAAL